MNLLEITQRLTMEHEAEILNVSPNDWTAPSWTRSAFTHDQVTTWTKSKSSRLHRFRLVLGEDAGTFRSELKMEKIKLKNFDSPFLADNYLEPMENRSSSSVIFAQDLRHWKSSSKSSKKKKTERI